MKRIEDIENLSLEELEKAAAGVSVPDGLADRLKASLAAETLLQDDRKRHIWRNSVVASLALAAAIAVGVFVFRPAEPKDTFDDPLLAYAQVEETFQYISNHINKVYNK